MRPLRRGRLDLLSLSFKNATARATGWLNRTCLPATLLAA
jgi:hypothetical protein